MRDSCGKSASRGRPRRRKPRRLPDRPRKASGLRSNQRSNCTSHKKTVEDLKQYENQFDKFLSQLDLVISTQGHEEIMNMMATLLDLFANDLSFKSIKFTALSNKKELTHLHQFIYPVTYWAPVIKSNELLTNAG
ncbi:hypothetical protein [Peribacillus sp. NPDC096540]|uniref:hypothetical protein n=1 Tax=Peribacillus sp. NPDC096540 TaxID=3390612 RepID=UPI003D031077